MNDLDRSLKLDPQNELAHLSDGGPKKAKTHLMESVLIQRGAAQPGERSKASETCL